MIKYLPGLIAAITAFLAIKLSAWALSVTAEALVFLFIYIAVTLVVDAAIRRYT